MVKPLREKMTFRQIVVFSALWITALCLIMVTISGVGWEDAVRIMHSPKQQTTHSITTAGEAAHYQWTIGAYLLALVFYFGFYVTPTLKTLMMWDVLSNWTYTESSRASQIRMQRATARMSIGPLIIAIPSAMMSLNDLNLFHGFVKQTLYTYLCAGIMVQYFMYIVLLAGWDYVWLIHNNFKDPPTPRSLFRLCCYGVALGCTIAAMCTPVSCTTPGGWYEITVLKREAVEQCFHWPSDYFKHLPYLPGYDHWSYHFYMWLTFQFLLPLIAIAFRIVDQLWSNPWLEWLTWRIMAWWITDVIVVVNFAHQLTKPATLEYAETHSMAFICDHTPEGQKCLDSTNEFGEGYYWMIAHAVLMYLPDIKDIAQAYYRKMFPPESDEFTVNESANKVIEGTNAPLLI